VHTEAYTSLLTVEVDGTPLPAELAGLLERGRITDASGLPDAFELDFVDSDGTLLQKASLRIGSVVRLIASANGPQPPEPLLTAEVTALEREDIGGSLRTRVRGADRSHRLLRNRHVAAYLDTTVADIVAIVVRRAGLSPGTISAPTAVLEHVAQDGVSDWVFLRRLADAAGCVFDVREGKLDFGPPPDAGDAPDGAEGARDDPVVLQYGVNTLYLRATVTSAEQVPEVQVRGWDAESKAAVVSTAAARTRSAELPDADPARLADGFGGSPYLSGNGSGTPADQDLLAAALADRIAGGFAEVEAHILGNPVIRCGTAIALTGFGAPFDGRYTATESVHDFDSRLGYTTTVVVSNASDRSLFGLVSASPAPADAPLPGVLQAVVTDTADPEQRGRVRLSFPTRSDDYVSGWARTVQPGAGDGRGWALLPEVGDEVLVAFDSGRFDRPVVLGNLYNGHDLPHGGWNTHVASGGRIERRSFTSRTGMRLEFVEAPGDERVELSTSDGTQKLTLTQTAERGIALLAEGPITITAKQDVAVSTSSGAVSIRGASVAIEATGALSVKGATLEVAATASADITGAQLTLAGSGATTVTSDGVTTVRGATVLIN